MIELWEKDEGTRRGGDKGTRRGETWRGATQRFISSGLISLNKTLYKRLPDGSLLFFSRNVFPFELY
jgi:hypothetical protein